MSESNTIVINTHPIKKITLLLKDREYEISAYMSMYDLPLFSSEIKKSQDYKRALSAVILGKINADGVGTNIDEIYEQDDTFFSEFISAVVDNNEYIGKIYADISTEVPDIERFGVAYEEYMRGMEERIPRISTAIKPIAESYSQLIESIDFNSAIRSVRDSMKNIGKIVSESMSEINNVARMIAASMEPFRQLSETIGKTLSNLRLSNISEEEISAWEITYKRWGELGWTVLPNAPFNLFKEIPEDDTTANKLAMSYCDKKAMDHIFSELAEKRVKKKDLESAIFCYNNKQYKACALLLFGIIDSKLIKAQPKGKYRKVGKGATKAFNKMIEEKSGEEQLLFTVLYQINLLACLYTYFASGDNFVNEPRIVNRNYIDHGMNIRDVRKRDCVQLFMATYNLCMIMDEL